MFYSSRTKYTRSKAVNSQYEDLSKQVPTLRVSADGYVWNDGSQEELLTIQGTIPVTHRGNSYNIPIRICLPRNFPNIPPLCYVEPTSEMEIKPNHKYVDGSGKMYLPYLHDWEESHLVDLVVAMQSAFEDNSPLFLKLHLLNNVKSQCEQLTKEIPSLHVSSGNFVLNSGRQQYLPKISGTIPTKHHGKTYNIPICIWLPRSFPNIPPKCYIDATEGLRIRPRHKHVDSHRQIYLPYLHQWHSSSDLVQLVCAMTAVFQDTTPFLDMESIPGISVSAPDPRYKATCPGLAPVQQLKNLAQKSGTAYVGPRQLTSKLEAVITVLEEELQLAMKQRKFIQCDDLDKQIKTLKVQLREQQHSETEPQSETKELRQRLDDLNINISDLEVQLRQKTEKKLFLECVPLHEQINEYKEARDELKKRIGDFDQEVKPKGYSDYIFEKPVPDSPHKSPDPAGQQSLAEEYSEWKFDGKISEEPLPSPGSAREHKRLQVFDELNYSEIHKVSAPFGFKYAEMVDLKSVTPIGEGNYGFTFVADWNGQKAVIKAPKKKPSKDEEAELSILMRLPISPNVVSMIGLCTRFHHPLISGEYASVIIPFMKNRDLNAYLDSHPGDPTELDYINIVLGICRGIAHLHAYNIVHRDIALRNFLVGDDFRILIADFGLSRNLGSDNIHKDKHHVKDEVYIVNPNALLPWRWCPPETFMGFCSKMSDSWMLGVTILEMFESVPFSATESSMPHMLNISRPEFVLQLPRACPESLKSLARRCCTYDQAKRPTIIAAIDSLLEEKEQQSYRVSAKYPPSTYALLMNSINEVGGEIARKLDDKSAKPQVPSPEFPRPRHAKKRSWWDKLWSKDNDESKSEQDVFENSSDWPKILEMVDDAEENNPPLISSTEAATLHRMAARKDEAILNIFRSCQSVPDTDQRLKRFARNLKRIVEK